MNKKKDLFEELNVGKKIIIFAPRLILTLRLSNKMSTLNLIPHIRKGSLLL